MQMTRQGAQGAVRFIRQRGSDLSARGEPFLWGMGGALVFGLMMITGFIALILYFGLTTFWPKPIELVTTTSGTMIAGEPVRTESFRVPPEALAKLDSEARAAIAANDGFADRTLYRTGNYDLTANDFVWLPAYEVKARAEPDDLKLVERREWGVFIGRIASVDLNGQVVEQPDQSVLQPALEAAKARRLARLKIEREEIGHLNHEMNALRLSARRAVIEYGEGSKEALDAVANSDQRAAEFKTRFSELSAAAAKIRDEDVRYTIKLTAADGAAKQLPLSSIVRLYPANQLSLGGKISVYLSRWAEFITDEPREANTEGGVWPAIFGTFVMTVLLSLFVAPFGVITALYLREYAKQGRIVSIVRISVNNLSGVPSIVYGVFGLGFFAYILGGSLDAMFFPERLPSPTFGTGGLLWASLTLALMTVPVVIVATEEALAAVPRSMREGSLGCGASKWQTIKWIVLPRAAPGIMTGMILAMARGAGEVAPLMLVGVVKLAPELPIDGTFPFIHLERSFMHLGFHIYDVGFQSRNSEAGRPMVFVTTLLLILLVLVLNAAAIIVRTRLKRRFQGSQF